MVTKTSPGIDLAESHSPSRFRILFNSIYWAAIVLIASAGTYFYAIEHQQPNASAEKPAVSEIGDRDSLGLTAELQGADLLLSWNRDAPPIRSATEGVLFIRTNNLIREVALTPNHLQAGRVLYSSGADQLDIRLQVNSAGHAPTESRIVVILPPTDSTKVPISAAHPSRSPEGTADEHVEGESRLQPSLTRQSESKLRLWSKSSVVMLARDASAAAELQNNPSSLTRLIQSGTLFTVAAGTEVAALQMESRVAKVEVMEGTHAGQEGWVDVSQASRK